jgi:hypothetical protein
MEKSKKRETTSIFTKFMELKQKVVMHYDPYKLFKKKKLSAVSRL